MERWQQKRFKEEWRGIQRTSNYWRDSREGSRSLIEDTLYLKTFFGRVEDEYLRGYSQNYGR